MLERILDVLEAVEPIVKKNQVEEWVSEETALQLLGCSRAKLYEYKREGHVKYNAAGKKHRYSRKSIDKIIKETST